MQHGLVSHRDVLADLDRKAGVGMHDAAILDVASAAQPQLLGVAAQHHAEPNACILFEHHSADDLRAVGHPGAFGHVWPVFVKLVERHEMCSEGGGR